MGVLAVVYGCMWSYHCPAVSTIIIVTILLQWNPYIADTIGELHVGRYRGPAIAEGVYKYYMYMNEIWIYSLWPLFRGGR